MKARYDIRARQPDFKVNDIVWCKVLNNKFLTNRYDGPWKIITMINKYTVKLQHTTDGKILQRPMSWLKRVIDSS